MMRFAIAILAVASLAGCAKQASQPATPVSQSPVTVAKIACAVNGVLQPIAVSTLAALAPSLALPEQILVAPAVAAWCAAHGGVPAATNPTVVPASEVKSPAQNGVAPSLPAPAASVANGPIVGGAPAPAGK